MPRRVRKEKNKRVERFEKRLLNVVAKVPPAPNPYGQSKRCTMMFSFAGYDGTTNPGFATGTFKVNDISDVDGAGGQPLGYDTMIDVFNRFKVLATRVEITVCPRNTGVERFALYPCYPDYAPTTMRQAVERPKAVSATASCYYSKDISADLNMEEFVGPSYKDLDWSGTDAASPSKIVLYRYAFAPIVAGTTYMGWTGRILFDVLWTEPVVPHDA